MKYQLLQISSENTSSNAIKVTKTQSKNSITDAKKKIKKKRLHC